MCIIECKGIHRTGVCVWSRKWHYEGVWGLSYMEEVGACVCVCVCVCACMCWVIMRGGTRGSTPGSALCHPPTSAGNLVGGRPWWVEEL